MPHCQAATKTLNIIQAVLLVTHTYISDRISFRTRILVAKSVLNRESGQTSKILLLFYTVLSNQNQFLKTRNRWEKFQTSWIKACLSAGVISLWTCATLQSLHVPSGSLWPLLLLVQSERRPPRNTDSSY